jgi:hypothetical protein
MLIGDISSIAAAAALFVGRALFVIWRNTTTASGLHAPADDRSPLDRAEHDILDEESEQDDGQKAGEDVRYLEQVLVLIDVPADAAMTRAAAEHWPTMRHVVLTARKPIYVFSATDHSTA